MCMVRRLSVTYGSHYCILCSFDLARQHLAFALLLFNSMDTLYMYVSVMSEINYYYYYYYYSLLIIILTNLIKSDLLSL